MKEYAVGDFAKAVLDVADSLAYATKSLQEVLDRHERQTRPSSEEEGETGDVEKADQPTLTVEHVQQIYDGVKMTETLLHKTLDRFGIRQFDPVGQPVRKNNLRSDGYRDTERYVSVEIPPTYIHT